MKIVDRVYWVGSGCVGLSARGDCHVYAVRGDGAIALVDSGMAADPALILRNMESDGLDINKLRYVLLTHAHPDHAGGCAVLQAQYGVKIVCSEYESQVMRQGPVDFFHLEGSEEVIWPWRDQPRCEPDIIIGDGDTINLDGVKFEAISTPGHTGGSVCYQTEIGGQRMLFSGDTIFYKGFISELCPPFSDLALYKQGIAKLSGRKIDALFPGHLMWVLKDGQQYIDIAVESFRNLQHPAIKPFS